MDRAAITTRVTFWAAVPQNDAIAAYIQLPDAPVGTAVTDYRFNGVRARRAAWASDF
jgi:hypothetical protein